MVKHSDWVILQLRTRSRDRCWIWPYKKDKDGYGWLSIKNTPTKVHHFVLKETGNPRPPPPDDHGLHTCDTPSCFNPDHLYWGSNKRNRQDQMERIGPVRNKGISNGQAKLTNADVRNIRRLYARGIWTHLSLAQRFGISKSAVGAILRHERWK